ncbi:MAG TPA: hypothetical protein VGE10_14645 [Zeimonas sp.]
MSTRMKIAVACYVLGGAIGLFMFGRYWAADRFMPYHAIASGTAWEAVAPGLQLVVLALLKAAAAGFLTGGVVALMLIVPIVHGENWARWTALVASAALLVPLLYVTVSIRLATGAPSPVAAAAVALALAIVGFVAARMPKRSAAGSAGYDPRVELRRS